MKVTEHNTMACRGSLQPRGHTQDHVGPFELRIGSTFQTLIVERWTAKHVLLAIEQPNEEDNFTLLRVLFLRSGTMKPSFVAGCKFRNAKVYRRKDGMVEVRIKKRYTDSFPHPFPTGKYTGSCMYDVEGRFAFYTLQAMSHRRQPEARKPKTIITPGDTEYDLTLAHAKRTLRRSDGVDG